MKKRFIAVCLAAAACILLSSNHTHSNAAAGDVTESIAVPCAGKHATVRQIRR